MAVRPIEISLGFSAVQPNFLLDIIPTAGDVIIILYLFFRGDTFKFCRSSAAGRHGCLSSLSSQWESARTHLMSLTLHQRTDG